MRFPTNKTQVVHSKSKQAFNVIGTELGRKYKIARCPYIKTGDEIIDTREKAEALEIAEFISFCFNNSNKIATLA